MWKKALLVLAILAAAPTALVNCAASGSGSIGEDGASGSASGTAGDGARSKSETTTGD